MTTPSLRSAVTLYVSVETSTPRPHKPKFVADCHSFVSPGLQIGTMRLSVALGREGLGIPLHALARLTTVRAQAGWLGRRTG